MCYCAVLGMGNKQFVFADGSVFSASNVRCCGIQTRMGDVKWLNLRNEVSNDPNCLGLPPSGYATANVIPIRFGCT